MSDFETRLTATLTDRAGDAPIATGLAQAARGRARRRRTTGVALAAVAVTGLLVGVPLGLRAVVIDETTPVTKQPEPEVVGIPADWRFESYRNIELAVPPEWGHGSLDSRCAGGGDPKPVVERPGAVVSTILCQHVGYGVRFGPAPGNAPPGATVNVTDMGGVTVTVIAADEETADRVSATIREIPGQDYYGCTPAVAVPKLGQMTDSSSIGRNGVVTFCRYEIGIEGPNLISSHAVQEAKSNRFWRQLEGASEGTGPDSGPDTCIDMPETEAMLVLTGAEPYAWVHYSGCAGHGLDVGGTTYRLDQGVMSWVPTHMGMSFDGSVPLPQSPEK